jgi:hypothetical protein
MHNGSLERIVADKACGPSDTALFAAGWLASLIAGDPQRWNSASNLAEIENFVGDRNRLALLDSTGTWNIIGEQLGHWVGGTWLSNQKAVAWLA